jgi:hypothetical protein
MRSVIEELRSSVLQMAMHGVLDTVPCDGIDTKAAEASKYALSRAVETAHQQAQQQQQQQTTSAEQHQAAQLVGAAAGDEPDASVSSDSSQAELKTS